MKKGEGEKPGKFLLPHGMILLSGGFGIFIRGSFLMPSESKPLGNHGIISKYVMELSAATPFFDPEGTAGDAARAWPPGPWLGFARNFSCSSGGRPGLEQILRPRAASRTLGGAGPDACRCPA